VSQLPRPNAVLFDWDSTLVDNWGGITRALSITFTEFGLSPWTEAQVRANAKHSMRDTFPALFGERWKDASQLFYDSFDTVHLDTLRPLAGAADLLRVLESRAVPMGVVSNKNGTYLRQEVAHLGWNAYFHRVVGAQDAERDKPAVDPVLLALDGTGIAPGETVWFVGDSAVDLACAHAAGCTPILLHPDDPHPEDLSASPPAVHLFGCRDLLERLA
jgi:phosphoglycolate phosphatase